jgi:hypothetical protein
MLILASQLDLHEHIDSSPDRVQETREREVEESETKRLRGPGTDESFDRFLDGRNLPPVPVLSEVFSSSVHL